SFVWFTSVEMGQLGLRLPMAQAAMEKIGGNKNKGWKLWRSPSAICGSSASLLTKGRIMEIKGGYRLLVWVMWKCGLVL
ncbi:hypothetical protein Tco_0852563, partial [Tanacetum coccineum]